MKQLLILSGKGEIKIEEILLKKGQKMSKHSDLAKELFKQGYNCSQAVLAAFEDETGLDLDTSCKIASSFGGGMGRLREVCGAVSGMFMVAGLKYGYVDPKDQAGKTDHYKRIQQLAKQFETENGSIVCRELLGLSLKVDSPVPEERTEKYYKKRPCTELVEQAAAMIDEYIQNQKMEVDSMLKIAVASEGKMVTEHFGHCEAFTIFGVEEGKIVSSEIIPNPGHRPGFLPNFLNDQGVNVIISGGMGGGAIDIFNEKNIEVIVGATGEAKVAAENYLKGTLKSTGSVCHEHQHHNECGE